MLNGFDNSTMNKEIEFNQLEDDIDEEFRHIYNIGKIFVKLLKSIKIQNSMEIEDIRVIEEIEMEEQNQTLYGTFIKAEFKGSRHDVITMGEIEHGYGVGKFVRSDYVICAGDVGEMSYEHMYLTDNEYDEDNGIKDFVQLLNEISLGNYIFTEFVNAVNKIELDENFILVGNEIIRELEGIYTELESYNYENINDLIWYLKNTVLPYLEEPQRNLKNLYTFMVGKLEELEGR